jgi:hypothetical protein
MDKPFRANLRLAKILGLGIAGALIGWLIDGAFGGVLIPAGWPVIIGVVAGVTIGKFTAFRSFK